MKTISVRDFNRHFSRHKQETCQVKDRDKVVGTWYPVPEAPKPADILARVKKEFSRKLPFTGAQILKAGKKR